MAAEEETERLAQMTPEERREEMLERIADNLSKRMKALAEREKAMAEREKAISEREGALIERENILGTREEVVRRRETLPPPQAWTGPDVPKTVAKYTAVIDGKTMQFYQTKDALTHTPVASTQKLMTALLVFSAGDVDGMATVPKDVYSIEPTRVGIGPGEKYSRRDLITALLVKSGNDLAHTLACDNAGSPEAFAVKMNEMAKALGMDNSNFVTPSGLPAEGQYSCARDMAILAFEAYQHEEIREIIKKKTHTFVFNSGKEYELYNTNRVLREFDKCNGMKTGFTYAAGHCLISSAVDGDDHRISVVLKSYKPYVWSDSKKLLEWGLALEMKGPVKKTDDLAMLPRL